MMLSPLQLELWGICRMGDKKALQTLLANNPEINLDFKDPSGECQHILITVSNSPTNRNCCTTL